MGHIQHLLSLESLVKMDHFPKEPQKGNHWGTRAGEVLALDPNRPIREADTQHMSKRVSWYAGDN